MYSVWRAGAQTTGQRKSDKKRPQQILHNAGYGDSFFAFVGGFGLGVARAWRSGDQIGVVLCCNRSRNSQQIMLAITGRRGDDASVESFGLAVKLAAAAIHAQKAKAKATRLDRAGLTLKTG